MYENDHKFKLSDPERAALVRILEGTPYRRVPFMSVQRNREIACGRTGSIWAHELRLIIDAIPESIGLLLDAAGEATI